jgi:hypothetical protein
MNRIVKKHYPVGRLPEDLREGLPEGGWVDIVITPESREMGAVRLASMVASEENVHGSAEEVLAHIDTLRDDR